MFNLTNFAAGPARQLDSKESWEVWKRVYEVGEELSAAEARGYRVAMVWRLTRAMLIQDCHLNMDERLSDIDADLFPSPRRPEDRLSLATRTEEVANRLRAGLGSPDTPQLGYYGLQGLTHPDTIHDFWPWPGELLEFEDSLLEELKVLVLRQSKHKTSNFLRNLLGLTIQEAGALIRLAILEAQRNASEDIETKRFLAEGWLIDYIERAREAADPSSEMKGLKELARVQGLTRVDPEDQNTLMLQAIARVAAAAERDANPGPRLVTVDEEEDEDG